MNTSRTFGIFVDNRLYGFRVYRSFAAAMRAAGKAEREGKITAWSVTDVPELRP